MKGLNLTKEFIDIVKEDPDKYHEDYQIAVEKVARSNAKYKGKPIPFLYQPMFFTQEDVDNFNRIGRVLFSIANKVTQRFIDHPEYRKKFNYPTLLEELILVDPGYEMNIPIGRYDLFYEDKDKFKFMEVNTDGTSGMNEDNIFSRILLESAAMKTMQENYHIDYFEMVDQWVEESLKTYDLFDKKVENPNIAIVDFMETGITAEFEEIKKAYIQRGYRAEIVEARELRYRNGKLYHGDMPIDMIYRRIVTGELIEKSQEIPDLISAYKAGVVCVIGSLRSQIMHNKIIFKILHDEDTLEFLTEEERSLIKNHIPITQEFQGDQKIFEEVRTHKDKYILKPIDSFASQGVNTGRDFDQEGWEEIVRDCWNKNFLYQEFIDPYTRPFVQFEEGQLTVKDFKLNIGVIMYNEKFAGVYTRISRNNIIFGREGYFSIPNMLVEEK